MLPLLVITALFAASPAMNADPPEDGEESIELPDVARVHSPETASSPWKDRRVVALLAGIAAVPIYVLSAAFGMALLWSTLWCPPIAAGIAGVLTGLGVTFVAQQVFGYRLPLLRMMFATFAGALSAQAPVLAFVMATGFAATALLWLGSAAFYALFVAPAATAPTSGGPVSVLIAVVYVVVILAFLALVYGYVFVPYVLFAVLGVLGVAATVLGMTGAAVGTGMGALRLGREVTAGDGNAPDVWTVPEHDQGLPEDG